MKRQLFQAEHIKKADEKAVNCISLEKLVEIQALALAQTYHTTSFDVKQLQGILKVGETKVYQLLRSGQLPSRTISRKKVVSVCALAQFLVMDEKSLDTQLV